MIFDSKGRALIGTGSVQDHFILGVVEFADLTPVEKELHQLRADLLADPYFKGVPSMQPAEGKTALFFHAKDDIPEVRREVFIPCSATSLTSMALSAPCPLCITEWLC